MDAIRYSDELQYLDDTLTCIDDELRVMLANSPQTAAYTAAARALQERRDERIARYTRARPRPYFGRVDFDVDDGEQITTYIGQYNIGDRVYSWDSPFAKELYYAPPESVQTYASPEGQVRESIRRKRTYDIQNSTLLDVTDEWTIDQPGTRSDRALLGKLSGNRDGQAKASRTSTTHPPAALASSVSWCQARCATRWLFSTDCSSNTPRCGRRR